jgi:hypothetical protein
VLALADTLTVAGCKLSSNLGDGQGSGGGLGLRRGLLGGDLWGIIPQLFEQHQASTGHCQSKFVYFAKTSEPDFAAIDFPAFFRVDLSGSMAAPSI